MARPPKEAYELSDTEKREVELVRNGKNREVCTTVLPFQSLERAGEYQVSRRVLTPV